ncbi:hypothetical protein [Paraburkholderia graminis]|uniref:hypothetical protein n=1 Tax=Paraburkholderia graminis TaxID=60548 RepID=UPI00279118F9|nr:hypothetical protein [Paraburkholderia graminis]MDQ0623359.1 hypothetical protein [Paraburkholderia graminis]
MQELYVLCRIVLNELALIEMFAGASQHSDPTHNEHHRKFVVVVHGTAPINKIARRSQTTRAGSSKCILYCPTPASQNGKGSSGSTTRIR